MAMMNEMEYRTIGSALAGGYRAAVYCRLSKDDDLQGESASIANQRDMLEKYCEKQGWEVVAVYQDDGFTGLNMERPDLQRMLRAIERRQINLVITKDLSRLGRNYLQTGHLIEDFFPRNGVRYIAMNDGIDTLRDNNDIAPFKNILNEMYSKDISKKVHSSYLLKAQKGQFTGCLAPFGYRKDPEDKNHLLIDEETAPIVRLIFGYALNGHGPNYIRRRLEEEKIPCPTWWNRERGLRNTRTKWEKKDPENGRYMWDFSVIKDLLMNPVYTGAIASQKKDYRFKIGTIGEKKPEDWIVVEGQHEPLIDRMSFDIVQNKLKSRQRPGQTDEISLFAGLLKCGECGKSLTVRYTNAKHVKSKVLFGLTKRQLVCFGGALLTGGPLYFLTRDYLSNSAAALLMIFAMLPGLLFALFERHGQPLEVVIQQMIQCCFIRPKERPYQTNNAYAALVRQYQMEQEVKAIVQKNDTPRNRKAQKAHPRPEKRN